MSDRDERGWWKPGCAPQNPHGRPRLPAELREIRKLTPSYIKMVIAKLARMTREELHQYLQTSNANNMEMMVASIIVKATSDGDPARLNFLLDRSIGKVVEERRVQIQPVEYRSSVRPDGALLQEVVGEAVGGTDDSDDGRGREPASSGTGGGDGSGGAQ